MASAMGARVGLLFTLAPRAFKWVFLVTENGRQDRSQWVNGSNQHSAGRVHVLMWPFIMCSHKLKSIFFIPVLIKHKQLKTIWITRECGSPLWWPRMPRLIPSCKRLSFPADVYSQPRCILGEGWCHQSFHKQEVKSWTAARAPV